MLTCGDIIALQCFPLGLLRYCRTVRSHRYVNVDFQPFALPCLRPALRWRLEPSNEQTGMGELGRVKANRQTASLRIQTTEANKSEFPSVSPERFVPFIRVIPPLARPNSIQMPYLTDTQFSL
jgi:hypothetical protein